jgi:Mn2+ and Fe2+ transporters of the NRAMP family
LEVLNYGRKEKRIRISSKRSYWSSIFDGNFGDRAGFLTQTAVFTDKLKAAFAFAILVSILIDIVVQMNIWRILGVSGKRAQDVANEVLPGTGVFPGLPCCIGRTCL